jgi:hypothetical protein
MIEKLYKKSLLILTILILGTFLIGAPVNAEPTHMGSITDGTGGALLFNPVVIFISGNNAYVASYSSNALEIIDITNPANPVHKGSITDSNGGALLALPQGVYVSGNYAYVTSQGHNALEIIDVTDPANPVHKGSLSNGVDGARLANPVHVFVSGHYAYVASAYSNALEIVDVTDPAHPVHKGSISNGYLGLPFGVFVSGNYAYVTSYNSDALEIVDVTDPANPVHKGSLSNGAGGALLADPCGIYVSGNYAYIASLSSHTLEIVDVTDPEHPIHKGSLSNGAGGALLSSPVHVFVSNNYAYVASVMSNALEIVDVTNPAAPVHKASIINGAGGALLLNPYYVHISGNFAYVASRTSNALEIVDVRMAPPSVTVSFPPPDGSNGWFKTSPVSGIVHADDLANVVSISCTGAALSDLSGTGTPQTTANLAVSGEGTHEVICTATDGIGNTGAEPGSANTATIKIDITPAVIMSISVSPTEIWPPNHKMVDVIISGTASDTISKIKNVKIEITDEYNPSEPSVFSPDIEPLSGGTISFIQHVNLEAWRNGDDLNGRVYIIHLTITDEAGNSIITERVVLVPHDKSK